MLQNPYQQYKNQSVMTASGPELTLMLYDGAIKRCNQAIEAIENKKIAQAHVCIVKAQNIIRELLQTLDKKYPIANEIEPLYVFIIELLVQSNISKDIKKIEEARFLIREFRETWAQAMKSAKGA